MEQRTSGVSRRRFMGLIGTVGLGVAGLAACTSGSTTTTSASAPNSSGHDMAGAASTATLTSAQSADEMDKMHEAGVKAFPAKTEGLGGQPLAPTMDGDTKVFNVTCKKVMWEVEVGKKVEAWTYNGVVPGPEMRVTEGDKVRVVCKNELEESTSIHFHGLIIPNGMDGVPYITQPPIKPGTTFTYEFVAKNPGTHMYHSHHNAAKQVGLGLLGAFIIEPKDKKSRPAFDKEYTMILNDGAHGYTINGKGFPATAPLVAKKGEKVLVRYFNEGSQLHPMHLHGMPQTVVARDGYILKDQWQCDTLTIAPGERWEVIIDATEVGTWAYHCHILPHAESEHGMFGMVTALVVQP